jgi:hypothetical protein
VSLCVSSWSEAHYLHFVLHDSATCIPSHSADCALILAQHLCLVACFWCLLGAVKSICPSTYCSCTVHCISM